MKVLLVSANRERIPYPVAPLGLLYLAAALEKVDHEVSILDLCFSTDVKKDIRNTMQSFLPDVVGVSIRNIDNLSYPGVVYYLPDIKNIVNNIRDKRTVPIILGGSAFSLFPKEILEYVQCDVGVVGEGEHAFVQILNKIGKGQDDFEEIDNVICVSHKEVSNKKIRHNGMLEGPIKRDLIDNTLYSEYGGMGNIQTKRGCQFDCSYCTYPILEGKKYRLRSPNVIADEMALAQRNNDIKHFFFVDSVFNFPIDHAQAVCKNIKQKKLTATWSCFASPGYITRELLSLMKDAGCTNIEFGTDALSEEVLRHLRKAFSLKEVFNASKLCREAGIKNAHYVIFGGPGETIETLHQAFNNIELLDSTAIIAMVGVRIYPGTPLQSMAINEGVINKNESLLEPRFYLSPAIPHDTLIKEVSDFATRNSKCIMPGLDIRSSERMFETLRRYYREGPLWSCLDGQGAKNKKLVF